MDETVELLLNLGFVESMGSKPHSRIFLRSDYTFNLAVNKDGALLYIKGYIQNTEIIEFIWRVTYNQPKLNDFLIILRKELPLKKTDWKKYKNYLKNEKDIRSISEKIC